MQYILSEEEYSRLKMPKVLTFSDVDITHFFKDNKGSIQVQVSKHDFHGLIILSKECVEAINKALI